MARLIKFGHNIVVTGGDDATKQVSQNGWNDGHNELGMFGHGTVTTLTVATDTIIPVNSMHKLDGQGAVADDLATITNTETAEFDELWLFSGAQTITLINSGNIITSTGLNKVLSTTVPTKLIRVGTSWYEVGASGSGIFPDTSFAIQDDGDITKQMLVQLSGATTNFDTTLTFVHTADRAITFPNADTTLGGLGVAQTWTLDNTFANIIHTGRHQYDKGIDVASGGIITLGGDGNVFDISGVTTINEILPTGWQAGSVIVLQFDGVLTVTHNSGGTNDILLGDQVNLTTVAGDVLTLYYNGVDWVEVSRSVIGNVTASSGTTFTNKVLDDFTNTVHANTVHLQARNESGGAITIGQVVYISGYSVGSDLPLVSLADADSSATMPAIGMVSDASIANNANGDITVNGQLSGFDTSTFTAGDSAYVSATAGALSTRPTGATQLVQKLGTVLRSHATLGVIDIRGAGRTNDIPNSFADILMTGRLQTDKGIDVASPAGGIMTLGGDGNVFDVTGVNTINEILPTGWGIGSVITLQFDGILTVTHNSAGTNDILLGDQTNMTTAVGDVLTLFFDGTDWVEVSRSVVGGGSGDMILASVQTVTGAKTFADNAFLIQNPAITFEYLFQGGAIIADRTITLPVLTGNDTLVFEAHTQTFTNKTFDANGTGNSLSNIDIADHSATGTPDATTFYRGDNTWATPAGSGDMVLASVQTVTGAKTFADDAFLIQNPAITFEYLFQGGAILADRTITLPVLTGNDTMVFEAHTATFTNKTFDANGTGNVITNIGDAETETFTTTKISTLNKALLNSAIVYTDQINTFGDFAQTFLDNTLFIQNPATTFEYQIIASAIVADRTLTIPLLTGNDTIVTEAHTASFTNKTFDANGTGNSLSNIDIADHSATGTPDATTFYRGDNTWATPAGSGDMVLAGVQTVTGAKTFADDAFLIQNPAITFEYLFQGGAIIADRTITLPVLTGGDTMVFEAHIQTLTSKVMDADNNTFSNFAIGAEVSGTTVAGTTLTISGTGATGFIDLAEITVPANPSANFGRIYGKVVGATHTELFYRDELGTETNLISAGSGDMVLASTQTVTGAKTFADDAFLIQNPAITFEYLFQGGAILADRTITLPVLTGNDTLVFEAHTQTFTNKSYDLGGTGNVLTGSTAEFNTALQADSFFFVSQNISNMATATKAQYDANLSDGTFAFLNQANTFTLANTFTDIVHTGRHQYDKGADIASPVGGIMTLGGDGNVFDVTGVNTINEILATSWQAGSEVTLQFDGALQLTHQSLGTNDLTLANSTNYTTSAGDVLKFFFDGTDWIEIARNAGEGSGGEVTTWTADHNAGDFDLLQVDNITSGANNIHNWDIARDATLADSTEIGSLRFRARDGVGVLETYATVKGVMRGDVSGSEDGRIVLQTIGNGTLRDSYIASAIDSYHVFNNPNDGTLMVTIDSAGSGIYMDFAGFGQLGFNGLGGGGTMKISSDSGGLTYRVPTGDTHDFQINSTSEYQMTNLLFDINSNLIQFTDATQTLGANAGGFEFNTTTGNTYEFFINTVSEYLFSATQADFQGNDLVDVNNITTTAGGTLTISGTGATGFIDIAEITVPANPSANFGRLYTKDVGTTHSELFYRDELGTETNVLTGSETTTWTANHDTGGFALLFTDDATSPAGTVAFLNWDTSVMQFNVPTGDNFSFRINDVQIANLTATVFNLTTGTKFQENAINISPIGTHQMWIPAGSWKPTATAGASGLTTREIGANNQNIEVMEFLDGSDTSVYYNLVFPQDWDLGTITFRYIWMRENDEATPETKSTEMKLSGVSLSNFDAIGGTAFGTQVGVVDISDTTAPAENKEMESDFSTAVTIAGTPVDGDLISLQLQRDDTPASGTAMTGSVFLIGVMIEYTIDASVSTG